MKLNKWFLPLAISLSVFLVGCNNEDEENEDNIVGMWVGVELSNENCTDPMDNSSALLSCDNTTCYEFVFGEDGSFTETVTLNGQATSEDGTFSISGGSITFTIEDEGEMISSSATFTLTGATLVIRRTDEQTGCEQRIVYNRPI